MRNGRIMRPIVAIALLVLVGQQSACVTKMEAAASSPAIPSADEGLVVGSFVIRGGGEDLVGRDRWRLQGRPRDDGGGGLLSCGPRYAFGLLPCGPRYAMYADWGGPEVVFSIPMPAGVYGFTELGRPGLAGLGSPRWRPKVDLTVRGGEVVYVGRLVLELPAGMARELKGFRLRVEDARSTTLRAIEQEYGASPANVVTRLMVVR